MAARKLTKEEMETIAELAANKAYDRFYLAVGKSITKKILWVLGAGVAAVWWFIEGGRFK